MKRTKAGAYTCRVPLFNLRLYVAVADTMDGCFDALPKEFQESRGPSTAAEIGAMSLYLRAEREVAVALPLSSGGLCIENHAHESFHTADTILMDAGVQEVGNRETCAYLTGWVARQIADALADYNSRKKGKAE